MSNSVGGVNVKLGGDASGLKAATAQAVSEFDKLTARSKELNAALRDNATVSKMSTTELAKLKAEAAQAAAAVDKMAAAKQDLGKAGGKAASGIAATSQTAQKLGQVMGPVGGAIGGVSSALGAQSGAVTALIGGMSGLSAIAAAVPGKLGAILGVLSLVIVGVVSLVDHFKEIDKATAEAEQKATEHLDGLRESIRDLRDELKALATGTTIDLMIARQEQSKAAQGAAGAGAEFSGKYGGDMAAQMELISAKADADMMVEIRRWNNLTDAMEVVHVPAKKIVEDFKEAMAAGNLAALAAAKVNALVQKQQFEALTAAEERESGAAKAGGAGAGGLKGEVTATVRSIELIDTAAKLMAGTVMQTHTAVAPFSGDIRILGDAFDKLGLVVNTSTGSFEALEKQLKADKAAKDNAAMTEVTGAVETVASGGFSSGGAAAGTAVGSVIDAVTGGATGGLGAVLGGIIGGILGKALDELITALGVLTPLFDAVAVIIAALQPILLVIKILFEAVGDQIEALAPLILAIARPVAALLLVVVRLVEVFLPLITIVATVALALVVWLDFLTMGVAWLDEKVFRPLMGGIEWLINGMIRFYNSIIELIRKVPGLQNFGTKAGQVRLTDGDNIGDFHNDMYDLLDSVEKDEPDAAGGASDGASDGASGASAGAAAEGMSLTNVPTGFKAAAAVYAAADAEQGKALIERTATAETFTVNIGEWYSTGDVSKDMSSLKRLAKQGHKGLNGTSRRFGDNKN